MLATAALTFAQSGLARVLRPGDVTVDATAGNGHDTLFLARRTAPGGVVHCFDVQAEALARTGSLLARAGLADAARLHACGHERLREVLPADVCGRVRAVVFNLGFLPGGPGGDAAVVTRPETTLAALAAAQAVLAPDGLVAVVCYTGHAGGLEEAAAVATWCAGLDFAAWRAARYELANKPGDAIIAWLLERAAGKKTATG
ncbi:class I SAM-dependent methyltransferase [Solidesulfovibrio alcoholivorans]|uniref:class I SAM-dependent methyltransferase n=1 Tax=Solidesulfovibrio alcoholivorans TaxID=81406 RepID=UPI000496223C|nr:class I SAM-dependent methyltransferase [Solidesulfovibrio alcoholivorans]